jgi:hypothetical protein
LALGLKKETADMVLVPSSRHDGSDVIRVRKSYLMEEDAIPAWSLHRLWELANIKYIIIDSEDEIAVLYDEVIMKIEQFIKDGYFNKEYLEEKK